jgi:outer membrane protein assembly factor BamD (BamD/ComL family)
MKHIAPHYRFAWTALVVVSALGCAAAQKKAPNTEGIAATPAEQQSDVLSVVGAQKRPASDDGVEQASFEQEEQIKTPGERIDEAFAIKKWPDKFKAMIGRGPDKNVARELYREGDALYKEAAAMAEGPARTAKFAEAGAKFAEAAERWPDSALQQDAYYMAGESYFFADYYVESNRQYEYLVKAYPNNRYLDVVDQRRFAIAKYWLDEEKKSPEPLYYANFTNPTRPWKDRRGNGLRVFDKIRVDDPTGRLADDATLAAANEHFAARNFMKADEYYTDLIKAYPTSEHQFTAHFLGLKAKLSSYLGPNYTANSLEEAEKLLKQMRRQFPRDCEREKEFLDRCAAEIRYKKAEKLMNFARFYDRRSEYRAAIHYYSRAMNEFNDTPFARQAEERIAQIQDKPPVPAQKAQWLVNLFPETDDAKRLIEASRKYEEEQQRLQQESDGGTMIAQPPQIELQR